MHANFFPLLILTRALCEIDEISKAQRGTGTCPKSHSWELEEARCDIPSKALCLFVKLGLQ